MYSLYISAPDVENPYRTGNGQIKYHTYNYMHLFYQVEFDELEPDMATGIIIREVYFHDADIDGRAVKMHPICIGFINWQAIYEACRNHFHASYPSFDVSELNTFTGSGSLSVCLEGMSKPEIIW